MKGLAANERLEDQLGNRRRRRMGRFYVDTVVANNRDVVNAEADAVMPDAVPHQMLRVWVDTGAGHLVLPASVADQLGLPDHGQVHVRCADQRPAVRGRVSNVWLQVAGRSSAFSAIVEPERDSALLGAIVLEELDLLVDPFREILVPRDPDRFVAEIE